MIKIFEKTGMPECIKVDNGRPFGDPRLENIPPLAMWLTASGIRMIHNRPRMPQDNAKVERSQGVMSDWTEWKKCKDTGELQKRLRREAEFHNLHYPVRRLENKTRIAAFPDMLKSPRPYEPGNIDLKNVLESLSKNHWTRTANSVGQISFMGKRLNAGIDFKGQTVSLKLDAVTNQWHIFDPKGQIIKKTDSGITVKSISDFDLS